MPLTPFHLGPGLFFGMITFRFFDLVAFLVGSTLLDIEPACLILYNLNYPYLSYSHHGVLHSFLLGIIIALLIALILNNYKEKISRYLGKFNLSQKSSFLSIFSGALLGDWIHLVFDSFMHYDVFPFWPSHFNPLLNLISIPQNYFLCSALGIAGLILLIIKVKKHA